MANHEEGSEVDMSEEKEAWNYFWCVWERAHWDAKAFKIVIWSLEAKITATSHFCEEKEGSN